MLEAYSQQRNQQIYIKKNQTLNRVHVMVKQLGECATAVVSTAERNFSGVTHINNKVPVHASK